MTSIKNTFVALLVLITTPVFGQSEIPLDNLRDFKPQAGNWIVVGEVWESSPPAGRADKSKSIEEETGKSKRKRKKKDKVDSQKELNEHAHAIAAAAKSELVRMQANQELPAIVMDPKWMKTAWEETVEAAEEFNKPGEFTT